MKVAAVMHRGDERVGVVRDEEASLLPGSRITVEALIEGGSDAQDWARTTAGHGNEVVPLAAVELLPPVRKLHRDVMCAGWNYWDHFEEGVGRRQGQEVERPDRPTFFTKAPRTIIGPRDPIAHDTGLSAEWDYEGELACIIGTAGRSIPASRALEHVWGYLLANDISQRDLQRAHGGQWFKGKSIDGTMPIGPWIVTSDELDQGDVRLQTLVNGMVVQDASTSLMAFPIEELIASLSWGMTLGVGDLLLTGTPAGVGHAADPPRYLQADDEVVVRSDEIGELRNQMTAVDLTTPQS